jgi:short-subunit dehydrogenase
MSATNRGVAIVTGASGGIGAVYADRLARRGQDLLLVARNTERLQANAAAIKAETGRNVEILVADLSDLSAVAALADRLAKDPSISTLVNNAGVVLPGGLLEGETSAIENLIAVNITAPTLLAAAAGKAFAARKSGTMINIASVLAFAPELFDGVYSGSKSYILNLTLSLAGQLRDTGVRVQAVLPGPVRTDIWSHVGVDPDEMMPGKIMEAGDLVDAALVGLDRGEIVTIPPLADESLWLSFDAARAALGPHLAERLPAPRYQTQASAA